MEQITKEMILSETIYGNVKVVLSTSRKYGVTDLEGNIIVPFGKYQWIDGFDSGLARVRTKGNRKSQAETLVAFTQGLESSEEIQAYIQQDKEVHPAQYAKWGIINEKGEEVLPVEYEEVWNFLNNNRYSTTVEKNGEKTNVYFCDLNPELPDPRQQHVQSGGFGGGYERDHYEEFAGTYAQDVEGYSDEDIYDAFDGDPDAYWNIG